MEFLLLKLRNFLSHKDTDVDLSGTGVTLITGRNEDESLFVSNGSGKSALLEGLRWGLYGRTARGLSTSEVVREGTDACSVTVEFTDDEGYTWTARRKRDGRKTDLSLKRNGEKLSCGTVKETQDRLERAVGMDETAFSCLVAYTSDNQSWFAEQTDSTQKSILESLLGLDELIRMEEVAKDRISRVESALALYRYDLEKYDVEKAGLRDRLKDVNSSIAQTQKALKALSHNEKPKRRSAKKRDAGRIEKLRKQLRSLEKLKVERKRLMRELRRHSSALAEAAARADAKTAQLLSLPFDLKEGEPCPSCLRPITEEVMEAVKQELDRKRASMQEEIETEVEPATLSILRSMLDIKPSLDAINQRLEGEEDLKREIWQEETAERQEAMRLKTQEDAELQSAMTKRQLDLSLDDQRDIKREVQGRIEEVEQNVETTRSEVDRLERRLKYLEFWKKGFGRKGLRSYILDSVIGRFNQDVNHHISMITGGSMQVELNTTALLKSGDERERLNWTVKNRSGSSTWKGCSVGERRRINVAVLLSMAGLAYRRSVSQPNLLFQDEVFDPLDDVGCLQVAKVIEEVGKTRRVFVITHKDSMAEHFADVLQVVKRGGVSRIES